jgi:hypothetical protein
MTTRSLWKDRTTAAMVLDHARKREQQQLSIARPAPDYTAANKKFKLQKAALTRAVNSKDPDKVVMACHKAVCEWHQPPFNGSWPDDWSRWQRALDDVLGLYHTVQLENLL